MHHKMTCLIYVAFAFILPIGVTEIDAADKLNVLFIAIDDLKPELGCYGSTDIISPSIDALAAESTVFLNAHCQFPVCGGSRASLMTGLRPEATGVMDLKTSMRAKNPDVVTLPQHFRNHGYVTAATGKIYDPRCVDDKKTYDQPSWSVPYATIDHKSIEDGKVDEVALASEYDDDKLTDGWIRGEGIRLMREMKEGDQPFFLAVGFKKPHLPFVAPKKYWDLYSPEQIELAEHRGGIENDSGYSLHDSSEFRSYGGVPEEGPFSKDLQRHAIHGYRACVSYIDAQVGLLLAELETLGLKDNTIVVVWGDHGFHLGDHGMFGKHTTLEQATRVPMMIYVPGGKGTKSNSPAELDDMYPTLAELAGIDAPQTNGRSLKPVLDDPEAVTREGALTIFKNRGAYGYSFRTSRYRYTEWVNKKSKTVAKELFDYQTDPLETINLANQTGMAQIQQTLARQLREHAQGCERLKPTVKEAVKKAAGNHRGNASDERPEAIETVSFRDRSDKSIREIADPKNGFPMLIGAASNAKFWDTETYVILKRDFSYVTPANDHKQTAIHPKPGKWKWKVADEWIERCAANNQVVRLHGPISPQCSKWIKADDRTPAELKKMLVDFMTALCKRYNDKPHVRWMDVVNETVSRDGTWFGPTEGVDNWENPWPQIGFDETHPLKPPTYIKTAFEIADKNAPNIKLVYNQHGGMEPVMWDKVKATIEYLQDSGVRVDGLGWQAHIETGFETNPENIKQLRSLIEWAQSRKLEFHITEFTAWIYADPIADADLTAQGRTYAEVLRVVSEYADTGVVTWCTWQIKDDQTERHQFKGNLFDDDAKPKPAYFAIRDVIEEIAGK